MKKMLLSCFPFFIISMSVAMGVPKKRLAGSRMIQSMKLFSTRYCLILGSARLFVLEKIHGKHTIAAVPFGASHDKECIINAKSAFFFGAKTPAGAKRGSFMSKGLSSPTHLME